MVRALKSKGRLHLGEEQKSEPQGANHKERHASTPTMPLSFYQRNTEAEVLSQRVNDVAVWLHGHTFQNNLIYNHRFDVFSLMSKARELGCSGIEIDIEDTGVGKVPMMALASEKIEALTTTLQAHGLEIGIDVSGAEVPKLQKALQISRILGAKFIRCYATKKRNVAQVMAETIHNLKQVVAVLEEEELLLLENHELLRGSELSTIRNEVGDKLQFVFDYGNAVPAGEDPSETLEELRDGIIVAHVKDQVIRNAAEEGRVIGVCLGEGNLDLRGLTRRLLVETPVRILALQNVLGYSAPFFRAHDEALKEWGAMNQGGGTTVLEIDAAQMETDQAYRDEIIRAEIAAAEQMMREARDILHELREAARAPSNNFEKRSGEVTAA